MFNIVEIDKLFTYNESFTPVEPYIFATQIATLNPVNYWTEIFGAENNYNTVLKQINSVTLNNTTELIQELS